MMLHLGHQHLAAVEPRLLGRDPVQGVGRPLDEDDDLVLLVDAEKLSHALPRLLVCLGRQPRLVPGAPVDARVDVREAVDQVAHALERRRAGGVVEVDASDGPSAEGWDGQVHPGEMLALLGPSGCGKTTTLRIIAGLEHADEGRVAIDGRDVNALPPEARGLGMVAVAAALRAGLPTERAVQVVAGHLGGPVGHRLGAVARSLGLGLTQADAWRPMYDLPAGARMSAAVARSADSGAALAGAFVRLADDLRTTRLAAVEAAGQRSGVLLVLPLGLCFLPAFVLAGIVPVIVAVLGDVLR